MGQMPEEQKKKQAPSRAGDLLCEARERAGVSLEEAAAALCIRAAYLDSIEQGRLNDLPGTAYAVGFVRSYANWLGLDAGLLVRQFKAESGVVVHTPDLHFPTPVDESRIPGMNLVIAALVSAAVMYGGWSVYAGQTASSEQEIPPVPERLVQSQPQVLPQPQMQPAPVSVDVPATASPDAESVQQVPETPPAPAVEQPAAPVAAQAQEPVQPETTPVSPPPVQPNVFGRIDGPSRVQIRATENSWVQVRDMSGKVVFMRVLHPGDVYNVPAGEGLKLVTGNAAGTEISVDGKQIPVHGGKGEVVRDIPLDADKLTAN